MSIVRGASALLAVGLVVGIAACGGGGGGGDSTTAPALAGSKIFVADANNGAIGSSPNSNPGAGTAVVDRIIQGGNTLLSSGGVTMKDFALDAANDKLYVADGTRILAFDAVSTLTGNVVPRVVATATGLNQQFAGIYLDTVNNRLYAIVRSNPGNEVRVYNGASTATNAATARTFSFTCDFMFDIAVDTTLDVAYVYYQTTFVAHVAVFDNQSTRTTLTETASRTIDFLTGSAPASTTQVGIFLDTANNRLYVPNLTGGTTATVEVFNPANTASGSTSSRTITLASVTTYGNVFVETTANRLYVSDPTSVTIAPNASTTTSSAGGVRVLVPGGSKFAAVAVKP